MIAVLLLVALVTILVVTTSMLARVERSAVSNSASTELARQNALFGLNVALAQLQKTAGPDQRITARADILDSNPATPAVDGFQTPSQAYWTGVWKTGNAPPDYYYTGLIATTANPTPTPQRTTSLGNTSPSTTQTTTAQKVASATWLVSDPIVAGVALSLDPTAALPTSVHTVTLAKNLPDLTQLNAMPGATPGPTVSVAAPLVAIYPSQTVAAASGTPAGKYAYWVSDEGIKAKANLTDPTYNGAPLNGNSLFVQSQLHSAGPQATATQDGLFGAANANDIRMLSYATDVTKVTTMQSLGNVGTASGNPAMTGLSGSAAAQYAPDVTTYSYGVLADVRNGGLKQDLSQIFESPIQFSSFLSAAASIQTGEYAGPSGSYSDQKVWSIAALSFDSGNTQSLTDFGVRWQSLYNYYSLYKNNTVAPASPVAPWSNINRYSNNSPGTNAPTMDSRYFNYTSNPTGAASGGSFGEMGENYAPQVLGFAITFSMSSQKLQATGSNPNNYSLLLYAEPQFILYNPYNVTISGTNVPYPISLGTNVISGGGSLWSVSVGGTQILSEPVTWNGQGAKSGGNDIKFTTSTTSGTYVLKPGEIRVYGLANSLQVTGSSGNTAYGNLCTFSNLGDGVGQSQWEYVGTDLAVTSPSTTQQWQANVADSSDVSVSFQSSSLASNNGTLGLAGSNPSVWPLTTISDVANIPLEGRFFNRPPNEPAQTADLGPIVNLATSNPASGGVKTFGYFVMRAKGLQQSETSNAKLANLPIFSSADGDFNPIPTVFDNPSRDTDFSLSVMNPSSQWEVQMSSTGSQYNSYWGGYDMGISPSDPSFLPLRDVPRQPMISLGQFMHMAMRTSTRNYYSPSNTYWIDTNSCMMGVGGSLADPYFPITKVTGNGPISSDGTTTIGGGVAFFDDNFLMNQALFDTYYFSTVPQSVANMDASYKAVLPAMAAGNTAFTDANIQSGACVLPNARMRFYAKNGVAPQTSTSTMANYLPNYQKSAANLLLNGAFNVNSTSIPAWRALLSSLSGNYPMQGTDSNATAYSSTQYPIYRLLSPCAATVGSAPAPAITTLTSPNLWASINVLTESAGSGTTQVTSLATAIVKQVKRLGPFLSMADFLNRRLTTASDAYGPGNATASIGLRGALQAAIDDTTINNAILNHGGASTVPPAGGSYTVGSRGTQATPIAAQLPANTAIGVPGWLMQQDLVQCFSPVMVARSDTFLVRCYGEADNVKTGATVGRAWGEAVVQRLPDFVDQNDPALTAGSNLGDATPIASTDAANQTFGRRFKVISFRWLNESDL